MLLKFLIFLLLFFIDQSGASSSNSAEQYAFRRVSKSNSNPNDDSGGNNRTKKQQQQPNNNGASPPSPASSHSSPSSSSSTSNSGGTGGGGDFGELFVNTESGKIRGRSILLNEHFKEINASGIPNARKLYRLNAWLGIPYAEKPLGNLRFKRPVAIKPWTNVLNATHLPNSCYQLPDTVINNFTGVEMWNANTNVRYANSYKIKQKLSGSSVG
jgi:hypothetical protein